MDTNKVIYASLHLLTVQMIRYTISYHMIIVDSSKSEM